MHTTQYHTILLLGNWRNQENSLIQICKIERFRFNKELDPFHAYIQQGHAKELNTTIDDRGSDEIELY